MNSRTITHLLLAANLVTLGLVGYLESLSIATPAFAQSSYYDGGGGGSGNTCTGCCGDDPLYCSCSSQSCACPVTVPVTVTGGVSGTLYPVGGGSGEFTGTVSTGGSMSFFRGWGGGASPVQGEINYPGSGGYPGGYVDWSGVITGSNSATAQIPRGIPPGSGITSATLYLTW